MFFPQGDAEVGDTVLEVKDFSSKTVFRNINFALKKGEILGFYGLIGAGRSEVMRAIFGIDKHDSGELLIDGEAVKIKDPGQAIDMGMAMVTEDRKELGLVLCRDIKENITLANLDEYTDWVFVNEKREFKTCQEISKKLAVKMSSLKQRVESLSGGNQQKVVLSKWLITEPKILILDEPTRGIDVGAKAEIHTLMRKFTKEGLGLIIISSELPEIIGMSDRVMVMGNGEIKGEFKKNEFTQDQLLACALGGK